MNMKFVAVVLAFELLVRGCSEAAKEYREYKMCKILEIYTENTDSHKNFYCRYEETTPEDPLNAGGSQYIYLEPSESQEKLLAKMAMINMLTEAFYHDGYVDISIEIDLDTWERSITRVRATKPDLSSDATLSQGSEEVDMASQEMAGSSIQETAGSSMRSRKLISLVPFHDTAP